VTVGVKDVAASAGVSVGTVSNVLNRPDRVAPATVERVQAAIERLGFVRNDAARQLRAGHSRSLGLLVLEASNPFFADLARGVEDRAGAEGLVVLVTNSDDDPAREAAALELFREQRVAGVVVSPVGGDLDRIMRLRDAGIDVVLVERSGRDLGLPSVTVDNVAGGRLAIDHLADIDRSRIAFIGGPMSLRQVADRHEGATAAARDRGLDVVAITTPELTVTAGRAAVDEMLDAPPKARPDAVFAANDLLALGVLREVRARGLHVPDDIAIVGYDDIDFAASAEVPLTSIRQPSRRLGEVAADLLISRATDPDSPIRHHVFDPEIVVRVSTAGDRP